MYKTQGKGEEEQIKATFPSGEEIRGRKTSVRGSLFIDSFALWGNLNHISSLLIFTISCNLNYINEPTYIPKGISTKMNIYLNEYPHDRQNATQWMLVPSDRAALGSSHIHEETKISSGEYLWCVQINYTILKPKLSSILLYF